MANPFHPGFGVSPPLLVGRDEVIGDFADALDDGPGSSGRATLYTGARGAGKTVMLNEAEDRARERGWLVVSETGTEGFVRRITAEHLPPLLRDFDPSAVRRRLSGLTAPVIGGGASWETIESHVTGAGLRSQIQLLTDLLRENSTGLLITLDEVHRNQISELRELATAVQHAFREEREVAFVGAGLASAVSDLINDDVLTFLRRADRHSLGSVARIDIERALREPILGSGLEVDADALELMVEATDGYPFLIQLVGAQTWKQARGLGRISAGSARAGISRARRRLGSLVHEPALAELSDVDKSFLLAMAQDDGRSKMADIQSRLGVDANYASQYRRRLLAQEMIKASGYGHVDFALPYLREYLREQAAADIGA